MQDLETKLLDVMKKTGNPGLSLAYISAEGKITPMPLGTIDANSKPSILVTSETIFQVASLSKPVFAYLVLRLAELGKINLDEPLFEILEHEKPLIREHEYSKALTARLVLNHRSGLPNMDFGEKQPLEFQFEPGTKYGYSGEAFGYLQKVIEKRMGESLEQLAEKYVFKNLKMNNTHFDRACFGADTTFAIPHDDNMNPQPEDKTNLPSLHAAKSLYTSPHDYAILIKAWINNQNLQYAFDFDQQCGILKISSENTIPSFTQIRSKLKGRDAVILYNDVLYYADQKKQEVIKIEMLENKKEHYFRLKSQCIDGDYKLANAAELELITFVTGHIFEKALDMTKDDWAVDRKISAEDLQKITWGLGWGLQKTEAGIIAFHWGDMGDSKAFVAINLENHTGVVYFANSWNGLSIAQDIVFSMVGNLHAGFHYLSGKYGYENHSQEGWKERQNYQLVASFGKYETQERAGWQDELPLRFKAYLQQIPSINQGVHADESIGSSITILKILKTQPFELVQKSHEEKKENEKPKEQSKDNATSESEILSESTHKSITPFSTVLVPSGGHKKT